VDDARLRVCLDRSLELAAVELRFRDWPGRGRAIVHLPDPFNPTSLVVDLAASLAPRYRVLSLQPRADVPYQIDADDAAGFLAAFGFERPVLLAEGVGCIAALLVATWHASLVAGVVLVDPKAEAPLGLAGRGLRECPVDLARLRAGSSTPLIELADLEAFLETSG
jgi:pimeloyl-ACP methyl ester carboxylesterase